MGVGVNVGTGVQVGVYVGFGVAGLTGVAVGIGVSVGRGLGVSVREGLGTIGGRKAVVFAGVCVMVLVWFTGDGRDCPHAVVRPGRTPDISKLINRYLLM